MPIYQNKRSTRSLLIKGLAKLRGKIINKAGFQQIENGPVNIHFGVHKTATTFLQDNLCLIDDPTFQYTPLKKFREIIRRSSYLDYLGTLDWSRNVLISDENMIGGNGTILSGKLYPEFAVRAARHLEPFKKRSLINVYITIRPMTSFLPSQYCEYLRRNKYLSYEDYTKKVKITKMSWFNVLNEFIEENEDLNITVFDFNYFVDYKHLWLKELSFGLGQEFDENINPSRSSFTYQELNELSDGEYGSNSSEKFDPHSAEEKRLSKETYCRDLDFLKSMPNVTIKP